MGRWSDGDSWADSPGSWSDVGQTWGDGGGSSGSGSSGGSSGGSTPPPDPKPKDDPNVTTFTDKNDNTYVISDYSSQGGSKYQEFVSGPASRGAYSGSGFARRRAGVLSNRRVQADMLAEAALSNQKAAELERAGMIDVKTVSQPGIRDITHASTEQSIAHQNIKRQQKAGIRVFKSVDDIPDTGTHFDTSQGNRTIAPITTPTPFDIKSDGFMHASQPVRNKQEDPYKLARQRQEGIGDFYNTPKQMVKGYLGDVNLGPANPIKAVPEAVFDFGFGLAEAGTTLLNLGMTTVDTKGKIIPKMFDAGPKVVSNLPGEFASMFTTPMKERGFIEGGLYNLGQVGVLALGVKAGTGGGKSAKVTETATSKTPTTGIKVSNPRITTKTPAERAAALKGNTPRQGQVSKTPTERLAALKGETPKTPPDGIKIFNPRIIKYSPKARNAALKQGTVAGVAAVALSTKGRGQLTTEDLTKAYESAKRTAEKNPDVFEIRKPNSPVKTRTRGGKDAALEFNMVVMKDLQKGGMEGLKLDRRGNVVKEQKGFDVQSKTDILIEADYFNKLKAEKALEHNKHVSFGTEEPGIYTIENVVKATKQKGRILIQDTKTGMFNFLSDVNNKSPLKMVDVSPLVPKDNTMPSGPSIYKGIVLESGGRRAHPLIGKSGGKWDVGTPKLSEADLMAAYGDIFGSKKGYREFTSPTEFEIAKKNIISRYDPLETALLEKSLAKRDMTFGKKSRFFMDEAPISEPLVRHGLKPKTIENIKKWIDNEELLLGGSVAQRGQLTGRPHRAINDIDFYIEGAPGKATELFNLIQKTEPKGKVRMSDRSPSLLETDKGHLFDIHEMKGAVEDLALDLPRRPDSGTIEFLYKSEKPVKIGKVESVSLSEQTTHKVGSSVALRDAEVMPAAHRIKDIVDGAFIDEPALTESLTKSFNPLKRLKSGKAVSLDKDIQALWKEKADTKFNPSQKSEFYALLKQLEQGTYEPTQGKELVYVSKGLRPKTPGPDNPSLVMLTPSDPLKVSSGSHKAPSGSILPDIITLNKVPSNFIPSSGSGGRGGKDRSGPYRIVSFDPSDPLKVSSGGHKPTKGSPFTFASPEPSGPHKPTEPFGTPASIFLFPQHKQPGGGGGGGKRGSKRWKPRHTQNPIKVKRTRKSHFRTPRESPIMNPLEIENPFEEKPRKGKKKKKQGFRL